ncbi:rhamnosyltransferase [Lacimicrobium alkaliphilum]|uniref:Rhamnosyltransferase n=1 Tax=Lacimicrobium alkaliphilum TaxID=1526571 RepID=A0A0U2Z9W4_9ALTE|nr:rhamnosyltransferase [Lacimicrobium alkaliphilum]
MKTGAVVILYKPVLSQAQALIESVIRQVDVLCVVDNSPVPTVLDVPKHNLNYHHFADNIGIAAAQNVGLRDLQLSDCQYGLLLDQDSQPDGEFVSRLRSLLVASKQDNRDVVAIGPRIVCSFSDKPVKPRVQRELEVYDDMVCVTQIISSGMMIDLEKLDETGMKEEALFIDGVDHEWCWRARQRNLSIALAGNVKMVHRLGDSRSTFAGITYKVGSPIRLYYQFRNILLLCRRSYVPGYWKTRNLLVLPIRFFANSILQPGRLERTSYMLKGLWDGMRRKDGPYSRNW